MEHISVVRRALASPRRVLAWVSRDTGRVGSEERARPREARRSGEARLSCNFDIPASAVFCGGCAHLDFLRRHGADVAQGTLAVHAGSHDLSASDALRRREARGGTRAALGPATGRDPCQSGGVHGGSHGDFRSGVKPSAEVLRPGRRLRTAQWACAVCPERGGEAKCPGEVAGAGGCGATLPDHLSLRCAETHLGIPQEGYFRQSRAPRQEVASASAVWFAGQPKSPQKSERAPRVSRRATRIGG